MSEPLTQSAVSPRVSPALELRGVSKSYGGVVANRDVSLQVMPRSIHALVGENGAGKSTLMKIAYGHARADAGEIWIKGERMTRHSVARSIRLGVGMVHQHFMLVGPLTVVENVVLGQEPVRGGLLDLDRAAAEIRALSQRFGLDVDPLAKVEDLSVGQQQRVEIVKVLWRGCDVLILDEPTAVLTPGEVRDLFAVLRGLVADGMTVVLITHKLDEVLAIASVVTVMRRGQRVAELPAAGLTAEQIVQAMVGRPVQLQVDKSPASPGEARLRVTGLHVTSSRGTPAVRGLDLTVRAGEILGIAGVEGNGQTELIEAIVGLRAVDRGSVTIAGRDVTTASVAARYEAGLAHVPEDRHDRALVLDYSIRDNLILGLQRKMVRVLDVLDRKRMSERAARLISEFDIRPTDPGFRVGGMSGGNQQKVVVARELSREGATVLVCAQPTRGVDIGANESIHRRIVEARDRGLAILLFSADLSELRSLSDRIAVLYKGALVATLEGPALAAPDVLDRLGGLMTGATTGAAKAPDASASASGVAS
ncbi:MAG: ABC transporter ATP-binding protein [Myxococcales bacterium]|nr:ABC transporter ATP-binding protein [Myxococcales bacterium]